MKRNLAMFLATLSISGCALFHGREYYIQLHSCDRRPGFGAMMFQVMVFPAAVATSTKGRIIMLPPEHPGTPSDIALPKDRFISAVSSSAVSAQFVDYDLSTACAAAEFAGKCNDVPFDLIFVEVRKPRPRQDERDMVLVRKEPGDKVAIAKTQDGLKLGNDGVSTQFNAQKILSEACPDAEGLSELRFSVRN